MVVVSYSGKEINAKLVYYGAGLSGKTTNLESIYEAVPDTSRGKMVSMKTQSDRTLFFDLLPLDLGEIMGFRTRFLLYTVPGQVFYNATRKLVLKGADAIVFVADSEVGKMEENKESIENLRANLAEYKINLDDVPWVIQYNKRDLPNLYTCDELNAELNPGARVPFFEAVATQGKGVFETFRGISHLLMEKVTKDLRRTPSPMRPAAALEGTPAAKATPVSPSAKIAPPRPVEPVRRPAAASAAPEPRVLDYGRQIDLAGEAPVALANQPAAVPREADLVVERSMPAAAEAKPVDFLHGEDRPVAPRPSPFGRPAILEDLPPESAQAPVARVEPAVDANGTPATVVVPVTLSATGNATEVVIRIVVRPSERP